MRVEEWETSTQDAPEGAINTGGGITFSHPAGGCGAPGCKCSPGWWISVCLPVDSSGIVKGWAMHFETAQDMRSFVRAGYARFAEWLREPF